MKERAVFWGSLLTGLLASACCIGPLLLGAVGLGSLGFAAALAPALAPLRPWLLGLTAALLATGFYHAYRPQRAEACAADGACARPASRRGTRVLWWVVAALALGLATFPNWSPGLARARAPRAAAVPASAIVTLDIRGMTCPACAGEIEGELRQVPGVVSARVDYPLARAAVRVAARKPDAGPLLAAVEKAGYQAKVAAR